MTDRRSFPGGYDVKDLRRKQARSRAKKQWSDPAVKEARKKAIKEGLIKARKRRAALGIPETRHGGG